VHHHRTKPPLLGQSGPRDHQRYLEHDLHRACLHEAAHVVIARLYGAAEVNARVDPTETSDPIAEKTFVGSTQFCLPDGLDRDHRRMIALAGTVAEELAGDSEIDGFVLLDYLECGDVLLSETDAKLAGSYSAADLDRCIALVRHAWPQVLAEASSLAEEAKRLCAQLWEPL
jgi:hypothetical protein